MGNSDEVGVLGCLLELQGELDDLAVLVQQVRDVIVNPCLMVGRRHQAIPLIDAVRNYGERSHDHLALLTDLDGVGIDPGVPDVGCQVLQELLRTAELPALRLVVQQGVRLERRNHVGRCIQAPVQESFDDLDAALSGGSLHSCVSFMSVQLVVMCQPEKYRVSTNYVNGLVGR